MRKHTRKQHERVSIFNIHGPVVEWRAAVSIAEHLTLRSSRFQVGSSRGALLTDPPKLRITLRCLLEVLRNETTARRGGPGSFDGVEEGCSGLKSAAEASHGSRGASRCVSITRLGKDGRRKALGRAHQSHQATDFLCTMCMFPGLSKGPRLRTRALRALAPTYLAR